MSLDQIICRLCLKITSKDVPYSTLINNNALLDDLKLIYVNSFDNLELTENPSICKDCEIKLNQLATFTKSIAKTEMNVKKKCNSEELCRLCLKTSDNLTTNWQDCKDLLVKCNIPKLTDAKIPKKICQDCNGLLQNLHAFIQMCTETEEVIVDCAAETGILTSKDLLSICLMETKQKDAETKEKEALLITKTRKTYKKKIKLSVPSTSKKSDVILTKLEDEFKQIHTSIDASPANITDVTLGENEEAGPEHNLTQELIDVLEGRLNEDPFVRKTRSATRKVEAGKSTNETLKEVTSFKGVLKKKEVAKKGPKKRNINSSPTASEVEPPAKKQTKINKTVKVEESDDEFVEDINKTTKKQPIEVTIIKSNKRTKKAELDKTWQELTGKSNDEGLVQELKGGMEIQVVTKKRGRPRLPETQRKAIAKKQTVWFYCDLCSFKTYAQNSLIQHQLIHNLKGPNAEILQCDLCDFKCPSSEVMKTHRTTHAVANLTYKCIFCSDVFKKKVSCMYHTLKHDDQDIASQFYCMVFNGDTDEEFFECYQCYYQDAEEASMPDHVIDHTVETVKHCLVTTFKCDKCQYITKNQELLERHNAMHNEKKGKKKMKIEEDEDEESSPREIIYKCDKCLYMTKNKRSLSNHKGLKHNRTLPPIEPPNMKKEVEGPLYYCNECSYSTHRKVNLPRHQLVHRTKDNMEFFECSHCIFETKHRRSYTRHLEAVHGLIA